ncbi:mucin-2 [Achroia grisella]|uniref:mucin-2 n=1 Tax=Achroia grisella TaxID=688607 RepID=UPI0027D252C5|nr:mucin-2 [Achroia grisella]
MLPALVAPLVALLSACASAGVHKNGPSARMYNRGDRSINTYGSLHLPPGCMYEGRWFTEGAVVTTHEACLSCTCAKGALSCRRRACAALPDPPPHRCHILHRKGSCCPELHCPDGITSMEHGASARLEVEDFSDIATPASVIHACVEGGSVYSAGSAMSSSTACEQCFCLGGGRRCVRPRCLPPPPGCRARPAPGACCPQKYYCNHISTKPPEQMNIHDCKVAGEWISEGERAIVAEIKSNCTQCFCLRGSVRCQPLACAPPLLGCKPLLRPGQCCPHQYYCDHKEHGLVTPYVSMPLDNSLISVRSNDRSFHNKFTDQETTTKIMSTSTNAAKTSVSNTNPNTTTTTKVKRKTNDPPVVKSQKLIENVKTSTTLSPTTATGNDEENNITTENISTEQPPETIKITINGTINCTAELSSTSLPLNITMNNTNKIELEAQPRIPIINKIDIEAQTFSPNDIITDRNLNGDFDENESFVINVTSSLMTNMSNSTPRPSMATFTKTVQPTDATDILNSSKKIKGEYDYDYTEPTLPPSLPNLKIIPFVAADAVVDDDISPKEPLTYPILEREDKYPVYYPTIESKETPFATRREDVYKPTKHPIFVSGKVESQYPSVSHGVDLQNTGYTSLHNDLGTTHNYTVSMSIGDANVDKSALKTSSTSSTFDVQIPEENLFSPPVETEGGFIPKGPGIIDEYYAVYPSTPSGPAVPHLTTSMQIDINRGECISGDGRHIPEGNSISLACSICTCSWGELNCSPRPCLTPPGCKRKPAVTNNADLCCGELICNKDNNVLTTPITNISSNINIIEGSNLNNSDTSLQNNTEPNGTLTFPNHITQIADNSTSIPEIDSIPTDVVNKVPIAKNETVKFHLTTTTISSTPLEKLPTDSNTITTITNIHKELNNTKTSSQEYEDEEEDDEGFSFGSVLKLLLSDSYETTTVAQHTKKPVSVQISTYTTQKVSTTTPLTTTTKRVSTKPTLAPFIPMPPHIPYVPPKKSFPLNTVNRIDHLVLGEATAIKRTTSRPATVSFQPTFKPLKPVNRRSTTPRPITTRYMETSTRKKEQPSVQYTPESAEISRPHAPNLLPVGPGLKLAGCNIYGRMYRVGRIIAELSTPCQECWCTELGVQCKPLNC